MNHIPAKSKCTDCDTEFEHGRFEVICPECGSFIVVPVQGRELQIDSIEIDTPDDEGKTLGDDEEPDPTDG